MITKLGDNAVLVNEEYGFRYHIWFDENGCYGKDGFSTKNIDSMSQLLRKYGGSMLYDVGFGIKWDEKWDGVPHADKVPVDFDYKYILGHEDENGNVSFFDPRDLSGRSVGIDMDYD